MKVVEGPLVYCSQNDQEPGSHVGRAVGLRAWDVLVEGVLSRVGLPAEVRGQEGRGH